MGSPDVEKKESEGADASHGWLRDQGLQLLVAITSVLTATCYLVGRAGLLGWYDAAGVPLLWFSWSFQDVVIRGMADADTWLLVAVCIVGAALYFAALDIVSGRFSKVAAAWSSFRARGEPLDRLGLRKRWAWEARRARLAHAASAEGAMDRWRSLGKRGASRLARAPFATRKWQPSGVVLGGIAVISLLVATFGLYTAGAVLLFQRPYQVGAQSFRGQYLVAAVRQAPARHLSAWKLAGQPPAKSDAGAVAIARAQLGRYPFVRLTSKEDIAGTASICGWLVQASGGQVLLLTTSGLVMRNFGDSAFGWSTESPDGCMAGSVGGKSGAGGQ